jgi:hypothetical protein
MSSGPAALIRDFNARPPVERTPEEVRRFVRKVMQAYDDGRGPGDYDRLFFVGLTSARAAGSSDVVSWLVEAPSSKRLDIACAVLCGQWRGQRMPREADIQRLLDVRKPLTLSLDAEGSYVRALAEVVAATRESSTGARVMGELKEVYASVLNDPERERSMGEILRRALPR